MSDEIDHDPQQHDSDAPEGHSVEMPNQHRDQGSNGAQGALEASDTSLLPFEDLVAPAPLPSAPPLQARWLALTSTLAAGLLGGLVGYGVGDLMGQTPLWAAIGGAVGSVFAAGGVGIVANLTLRAMNEWKAVEHPEQHKND